MAVNHGSKFDQNVIWSIEAFYRRSDAKQFIKDFNMGRKFPVKMKIVPFDSAVEDKGDARRLK